MGVQNIKLSAIVLKTLLRRCFSMEFYEIRYLSLEIGPTRKTLYQNLRKSANASGNSVAPVSYL